MWHSQCWYRRSLCPLPHSPLPCFCPPSRPKNNTTVTVQMNIDLNETVVLVCRSLHPQSLPHHCLKHDTTDGGALLRAAVHVCYVCFQWSALIATSANEDFTSFWFYRGVRAPLWKYASTTYIQFFLPVNRVLEKKRKQPRLAFFSRSGWERQARKINFWLSFTTLQSERFFLPPCLFSGAVCMLWMFWNALMEMVN